MSRRLPEREEERLAAAAASNDIVAGPVAPVAVDVDVPAAALVSALRLAEAGVVGGRPNLPPLSAELSSSIRATSWPRRAAILCLFSRVEKKKGRWRKFRYLSSESRKNQSWNQAGADHFLSGARRGSLAFCSFSSRRMIRWINTNLDVDQKREKNRQEKAP